MDHDSLAIVLILTVGFALASFLAYLARLIKMPAILGYLIAGYMIGPYSPGFVADLKLSEQLAEIGVILMLFGVGLHFKLQDLISVKAVAVPGAMLQTFFTTVITAGLIYSLGGSIESGLILGLSIGVASTVVLVRVLTDNHLINTKEGHIAVGWLVVEDIFTVIILILLPTIAKFSTGTEPMLLPVAGTVALVVVKFIVLAWFMFTWGQKIIDFVLIKVARLHSQELFTLTVIALMFAVALGSKYIFGVSIALGAFIAGMVIGKTNVRHQAAANALPLKDIFAVFFFISIGMLFNPVATINHFSLFLVIIFVVLVIKPLAAFLITLFLGQSYRAASTIAFALAQIGEFSFILGIIAIDLKLMSDETFDIMVAAALVSISLNPLLFQALEFFDRKLIHSKFFKPHAATKTPINHSKTLSSLKVHIIGFGPIGKKVAEIAKSKGYNPVIIEHDVDIVESYKDDYEILFGDATEESILEETHLKEATFLFITVFNTETTLHIIEAARNIHPNIRIIAQINSMQEQRMMEELKVSYICSEKETLNEFLRQLQGL